MTLPVGWAEATVDDLGEYLNGMAFKPTDWGDEGIGIIRIQNLTAPSKPLNRTKRLFDDRYRVRKGDLLVSWSATLDAFIWDREDAVLNQHIFKVTPSECVDPRFLFFQLRQLIAEMATSEHLHGSTMKHINRGPFLAHSAALPPLGEQRRIVAKLETLTARLARARAELDRVPVLAANLRQSSLDAAFSGTTAQQCTLLDAVNQDRGICYGVVQTGEPVEGGVPTVRGGDIKRFSIRRDILKQIDPKIAQAYRRTFLRGGEVIISIRGTIGNPAVVREELAGCNISREVALIPVNEQWDPDFIAYLLTCTASKRFLTAHTKGTAQPGINLVDLRRLSVPLCPRDQQREIVASIHAAFGRADRLEAEATRARALLDRLESALLAKAFRGELVPQDQSDEPAQAFLDRIRTQRAAAPKAKRGRKAKVAA